MQSYEKRVTFHSFFVTLCQNSSKDIVDQMKRVFKIKRIPFGKEFLAITIGEFIFATQPLDKYDMNHELIHVQQQRELLYILFFIWYAVEWLVLYIKYRDKQKAYFNIRFEKEAYRHQHDLSYLSKRKRYHYQ